MDEDPWAEYARLQAMLDRTTDVYKAAGIETAMADLLEKIAKGEACTARQTKNLVINRIGKERRRRAIIHAGRHDLVHEIAANGPAESRLTLVKCAQISESRDFGLLVNLALGRSYSELAKATGANENTLKTRAYRARRKIMRLAA